MHARRPRRRLAHPRRGRRAGSGSREGLPAAGRARRRAARGDGDRHARRARRLLRHEHGPALRERGRGRELDRDRELPARRSPRSRSRWSSSHGRAAPPRRRCRRSSPACRARSTSTRRRSTRRSTGSTSAGPACATASCEPGPALRRHIHVYVDRERAAARHRARAALARRRDHGDQRRLNLRFDREAQRRSAPSFSTPSSIGASSTRLNESRTASAPRPSGKKSVPGTIPTPCSTARCASATESAPGERQPGEEAALRRRPARAVRHRALERGEHPLALAPVQRPRARELLVDPAAAHVLLEEPLPERAGALVGVLLRRDEPSRDLGRRRPPSRAGRRGRTSSTSCPPGRRRRGRATRGSGASPRRSRARGRRRPRRAGSRTGAPARPGARAARATRLTPAGFWWSGMV